MFTFLRKTNERSRTNSIAVKLNSNDKTIEHLLRVTRPQRRRVNLPPLKLLLTEFRQGNLTLMITQKSAENDTYIIY